jgi:hypothetical protein
MSRYRNDPHWLQAKFPSTCSRCKAAIAKGDQAFYYPASRSIYCKGENCGQQCARDFEAHAFDESGY